MGTKWTDMNIKWTTCLKQVELKIAITVQNE